jgi:hypothetical protein
MLRRLVIAGSERIRFDVCSLDVEGEVEGADPPGVCFVRWRHWPLACGCDFSSRMPSCWGQI